MDMKEVQAWARQRDAKLNLEDDWKLFQNNVEFSHMDGTHCRFTGSWVEVQPCAWSEDEFFICIFTEHHGYHVYCSDEFRYVKDDKRTIVEDGEMVLHTEEKENEHT